MLVDRGVVIKFGVECGDKLFALLSRYDVTIHYRENLNSFSYGLYIWSTDECHREWTRFCIAKLYRSHCVETTKLTTIRVAKNGDVHSAKVVTIEHDEPCTCAKDRKSTFDSPLDRKEKLLIVDDTSHCCALTTRNDKTTTSRSIRVSHVSLPICKVADEHTVGS